RRREAFAQDDEEEDIKRLRCLAWLSRELSAPVAYWNHMGWEGLDREFAFGFDAEGLHTMSFFNESEFHPATHPPDRPRSAMTGCLWHVGAAAPNVDEAGCFSELRAFRAIG